MSSTYHVVCLPTAPRVQLFVSVGSGWPPHVLQYHDGYSSCQSAATSKIVNLRWAQIRLM